MTSPFRPAARAQPPAGMGHRAAIVMHAAGTPWREIVLVVVALRLVVSAVAAAIRVILPAANQVNTPGTLLLDPWQQFDALHFTAIAAHGYQGDVLNAAYMPLYPLFVRIASAVTGGNFMSAGLLVSNIACGVGAGLFWQWAADRYSPAVAWRSLVALLLFPDSFYLLGVYSESLFFALSAGCLLASIRGTPVLAGILAGLATLTRLQGLVLMVPLAFAAWQQMRSENRLRLKHAVVLMPGIVLVAYQAMFKAWIGGPSIVDTFQQTWHIHLQTPWATIWQYVESIRSPQFSFLHSQTANYVMVWDLCAGLVVLGMLLAAWKRLGLEMELYGLAAWSFALSRWYSTGRYMLAVLPFFLAAGLLLEGRRLRQVTAITGMLMFFFISQFVQGSWID